MHEGPDPSSLDVAALRAAEFSALADSAYLNAASFTPIPECSRRAIDDFHALRQRPAYLSDEQLVAQLVRARAAAARLVGALEAKAEQDPSILEGGAGEPVAAATAATEEPAAEEASDTGAESTDAPAEAGAEDAASEDAPATEETTTEAAASTEA